MKRLTYTGIGFRKDFAEEFLNGKVLNPAFIELAPENWIDLGGYWKQMLIKAAELYPIYLHGLSLSLGSPEPLNKKLLKSTRDFIREFKVPLYSEHLSFTKCNNAHLYELLPVPFRYDAAMHIAERIKQVQDFLGMELALEIVSYYTPLAPQISELEFINTILEKADCGLLLDVNNVYVNAFNHNFNAEEFIAQLPLERVRYIHMAGHTKVSDNLIIDTHGENIIDPVYQLLAHTTSLLPHTVPVLLERDFNIPSLQQLKYEMNTIESICINSAEKHRVSA